MNLFIGYESALQYWRSSGASLNVVRAKPEGHRITAAAIGKSRVREIGTFSDPIHFVVSSAAMRTKVEFANCHVWKGPASTNSYVKLRNGLYLSSPEACFAQLATRLDLVELIQVGYEICGTYALCEDGFRSRIALTTKSSLGKYAQKLSGQYGSKKVRVALRFIADGSASPMETILAMLLCLPPSKGGYGLKPPNMNYRVNIEGAPNHAEAEVRAMLGHAIERKYRVCDLYWPQAKLAVEYDSDSFHVGGEKIAKDADRRSSLALANVKVVTVTRGQLLDARAFDRIARLLRRRMGKQRASQISGVLMRRFELRSALLGRLDGSAITPKAMGEHAMSRDTMDEDTIDEETMDEVVAGRPSAG